MPNLYIVAGPNGVGKTTFVKKFMPSRMRAVEFLNADMIAAGLSPFDPAKAAWDSARILLRRLRELADQRQDFALETTLTGRAYFPLLRQMHEAGYAITLDFLWVPELAITEERVRRRVAQGGHNIPSAVQERRFGKGLTLLTELYRHVAYDWRILDNSGPSPHLVVQEYSGDFRIFDFTALGAIEVQSNLKIMESGTRGRVEESSSLADDHCAAVLRAAWLAYADAILDGQRYQTTIVQWRKERGVVFITPELLVPLARRIIEVDGQPLPAGELQRFNEPAETFLRNGSAAL